MTHTLLAIVTEELALVDRFTGVLAQEESALVDGTPLAALPALIEEKMVLTAALADCATRRDARLETLGYPAGEGGMAVASRTDPGLAAAWAQLSAAARVARSRNDLNGLLIRTRMDYNQQALNALMQAAAKPPAVYGADGRMAAFGR